MPSIFIFWNKWYNLFEMAGETFALYSKMNFYETLTCEWEVGLTALKYSSEIALKNSDCFAETSTRHSLQHATLSCLMLHKPLYIKLLLQKMFCLTCVSVTFDKRKYISLQHKEFKCKLPSFIVYMIWTNTLIKRICTNGHIGRNLGIKFK